MAHVHLVIGPVGAGKSTFAAGLCREHRAVGFTLDAWMAQLYGRDERPAAGVIEWYLERRDRCFEQIWRVAKSVLAAGTNVVLEVGLIQRAERADFYRRVSDEAHPLTVYVLDAPRDVRSERVALRNIEQGDTFSTVVPPHFFELANDLWQPPDEIECEGRDIRFTPPTISWCTSKM
jgi:predicted kinase